ncbi:hypothetical protein SERLA73DRAFT_169131 [Serpula lacrymans var. lacrymans S7.3]|uniref:Phenylacetyl-CoA ligase n=2 Tax=Serpula lacrymans var. lacrymans TaxID=341189 RepID=F8Q169_SERL3|nr:uncharacterized protein SERLADRAFT_449982 [Serpula lacrymans var. lacrymans S7.9]EGN98047.1 hypothetical protein SERLA73DRAFT_169131 [Serpula lacrymans var. lacrymans S7.3]EGO23637.1 hypothetical protein SERLADRAFT_449982 [Serpula lacrymans var. lacrymans S7.9]
MAEIQSLAGPLPTIPDNLTLAQFILDSQHPARPIRTADSPWIIDDRTGRGIGLEELRVRTYGLANALCFRYGIILLFSPNHVDYLVAVWAAHRLGAVMSGANPLFSAGELEYQMRETRAKMIITHPDSWGVALEAARASGVPDEKVVAFDVEGAPDERVGGPTCVTVQALITQGLETPPSFVERRLEEGEGKTKLAFYNFSSGTTGRPKAVAIPHIAPIANILQLAAHNKVNQNYCPWEEQRFRPGDICNGALPLYHIYGLVFNSHFSFFCGMSFVLTAKFNFIEFLKNIVTYRITHLLLVPPQIVLLCKHPAVKDYDLSHVRYITSGAAPLSRELMERLVEIFPNAALGQSYGTTETCTVVTSLAIEKKQDLSGSAGTLLPGITARVVKPDGSLADFGEPGELVVKTPSIALGYSNNEKSTKETFVDGWMRTGDEVKIEKNAEIFEMLKVRGFQVAPAELEGCLLDHPDVADTCVVGITDDYSGELPLAFVVLRPEAGKRAESSASAANDIKQSIMKHVADNKVAYKKLAGGVEFVDMIPKNPSGKLLRRVLRDKAREMRASTKAKL